MTTISITNKSSLGKLLKSIYRIQKIRLNKIHIQNSHIRIEATSTLKSARCHQCGKYSHTQRSSYLRKIKVMPLAGYSVEFLIKTFRYKCGNTICVQKIFCEQLSGFAERYSRKSILMNKYIRDMIIEVSSNKASYLLKVMGISLSCSSCLRLIKSYPMTIADNLTCIGIDDWAKRKGMEYGSIIVDSLSGKTIDLIKTRDEIDVIEWLKNHPNIRFVTRDRSLSFAKAIRKGLPLAEQIADKFHLVKNLSEAINKDIKNGYSKIKNLYNQKDYSLKEPNQITEMLEDEDIYIDTYKAQAERYEQYNNLKELGLSISAIAKQTNTHRGTVSKYLKNGIPGVNRKMHNNYELYLCKIYSLCRKQMNPSLIYKEIVKYGFRGCERSFTKWFNTRFPNYKYKWKRDYCINDNILHNRCNLPSYKRFSIMIMNEEYGISKITGEISKERIIVDQLIKDIPFLSDIKEKYNSFREAINGNNINKLEEWYFNSINYPLKHIKSFAIGLQKDWIAINNAVKYDWHNSLVEGCVNRLKCKKREMYGRASFELLRRKVCLSVMG